MGRSHGERADHPGAGATRTVGEPVARRLLQDGFAVRLLTRDVARARAKFGPEVECLAGEVGDRISLERALDGCAGVHVSLNGGSQRAAMERVELRGTATVAELAARHGVHRLTYVSGYLARREFAAEHFESRVKLAAEQAIRRSGVPFTIFKPTYFMETLPRHVQGRRAVAIGWRQPTLHMMAGDDFGRMVAAAFRTPEAADRELFVQGPEAVTIPDALRVYCSTAEPDKRAVTPPLPVMAVADRLFMGGELRRTIDLMRLMRRSARSAIPPKANRILGAPTTTLVDWCQQRQGQSDRGAAGHGRQPEGVDNG